MRRILAALVPAVLLLSACGSSDPGPSSQPAGDTSKLSTLKVTDQGADKAPRVEFAKPLNVTETTIKTVHDGTGDRVKENQKVEVGFLAYNAQDGSQLADNYLSNHQQLTLNDAMKKGNSALYNAVVGAKLGSDLGIALPPDPTSGSNTTQLMVLHLFSAKDLAPVLSKPEGDAVTPPAGLPKVTVDKDQKPTIDVKGVATPKALVAQDLIKGKGDAVKATDTIVANYTGVRLADGKVFDASFQHGGPQTFSLSGVIPGWTKGLTGKTVGSRVLLVIPAADAYGEKPSQGQPAGPLVFVVDILGIQ
ncbi:FKBP-type peptidyl-prolyl cis-trans isomerase [Arthrobacter sp. NPDC090010]|uniref:FKBP-type peptidyl-prolyl cis-trans isomerase n=1 Tax=Arthrobacter sp. NPDC090010 TaxID=3363942 RepID=UPI0038132615